MLRPLQSVMPVLDFEAVEDCEVLYITCYEYQAVHRGGCCNLTIRESGSFPFLLQSNPFGGMPRRGPVIIGEDLDGCSYDGIQICLDGVSTFGSWQTLGSVAKFVPDDTRSEDMLLVTMKAL